jgi:asparagine synthetase B (glutamine-hydrolysing)
MIPLFCCFQEAFAWAYYGVQQQHLLFGRDKFSLSNGQPLLDGRN